MLQIQTGKEQFQNLNKMRFIKLLIFLVFVSCSSSASETYVESEALPFSIINEKILFIGNSFTFYWNLPSQVEKMSIERGLNWVPGWPLNVWKQQQQRHEQIASTLHPVP